MTNLETTKPDDLDPQKPEMDEYYVDYLDSLEEEDRADRIREAARRLDDALSYLFDLPAEEFEQLSETGELDRPTTVTGLDDRE